MSASWIKEILDLVKETGDRLVVADPDGERVFVVMDIESYKDLRGFSSGKTASIQDHLPAKPAADVKTLTEGQLLNRINREIAVWKDAQSSETSIEVGNSGLNQAENVDIGVPQSQPERPVQEEKFYFEPVDDSK